MGKICNKTVLLFIIHALSSLHSGCRCHMIYVINNTLYTHALLPASSGIAKKTAYHTATNFGFSLLPHALYITKTVFTAQFHLIIE